MCRTRLRLARIGCGVIAGLLLVRGSVFAQDVTEPALKAAFIYNFAKFTEWPEDAAPAKGPILLCVLGDAAVGDALVRAVNGRVLAGHSMSVASMEQGAPRQECHVLYMSGMTLAQAAEVIAGLHDVPVLTISDLDGFIELGGIARFFFDHGQLRFSVHLESAERARLHISSRLLALAIRK